MKKIGIILIREGSKGLPNKNIRHFCGRPLCFWTIEQAIKSNVFDEVWVSSDSEIHLSLCDLEFRDNCKYYLRSPRFATDETTTFQTLNNLFSDKTEDFVFMNLQVTSPIRTIEQIKEAMLLFETNEVDHLVSFSQSDKSKRLFMTADKGGLLLPSCHGGDYVRQNEPKYIYPTGSIWVSTKSNYLRDKTFYTDKTFVYLVGKIFSFDIDDACDFEIAEYLFKTHVLER